LANDFKKAKWQEATIFLWERERERGGPGEGEVIGPILNLLRFVESISF